MTQESKKQTDNFKVFVLSGETKLSFGISLEAYSYSGILEKITNALILLLY
jgi:hypothetical protein